MAQKNDSYKAYFFPTEWGLPLNQGWKYHKGDSMRWAEPDIDDKSWKYIQPELDLKKLPAGTFVIVGVVAPFDHK